MAGKGQPRTGGRAKGTTNKLTADVKGMVLEALAMAGGVSYLVAQSESNPNAFLTLIGKVLPMTVASDPNNPLLAGLTVMLVKPGS